MAYKGVKDDFKAAIELRKPSRVPICANSEEFDVHVCGGGVTYNEYNRNAEIMAATQIAAIKRFDYDWAWLQVDDCLVYEVLGVEVRWEGDILPATCGYLPATRETLNSLPSIDPKKDGRMPVLLEALKRIKEELGDEVVVVGRTEGPFSAVAFLYGIEEAMLLPLLDPELLADTLKYFVDVQTAFGLAQREAGADAVWFGDCNASGHLMSEQYYSEYAVPSAAQVVKEYDKAGLWSFYHASEEKIGHLKLSTEVGMSLLSTGPGLDIAESKAAVGSKVGIIGNLDPIGVLMNGTPDQVDAEARRIMRIGKENGGYVFCTGEMNPRDTPLENMEAMLSAAREESYY
jgi:MtaA/CmuA family methyltransferase